jgi:hypothetical protein
MGRRRKGGGQDRTVKVVMRCHNGHQFPLDVPAIYQRTEDKKTLGPMPGRPTRKEKCPVCKSQRLERLDIVSGPES